MMGLWSMGNGGSSSSSSNLSPLAPPFTVDRSNSKPSSNQLFHYSDSPYTVTASFGSYADPSTTRHGFYSNHEVGADYMTSACLPLSPEASPSGPVKPSSTIWSTSNPTAKTSSDAYSFGCEVKGYYAPYVSPIMSNDNTPLVGFNDASYDVLPNSGALPVNASSQVDYTQSLSGLEYGTPHWNSIWSSFADEKHNERKELDGSFSLEKVNPGASFVYKNCMTQGDSLEGVSVVGEGSCALPGNFTERTHIGSSSMGYMDEKPYLAQKPGYPSFNSNAAYMGTIPTESSQVGLSVESSKSFLNYANPYSPHEKCFQPLESCLPDTASISKPSPVVVIRPPPSGSRSSAQKVSLRKTVDICKPGASNSEKSDFYDLSKGEETQLSVGSAVKGFSLGTSQPNYGKDFKGGVIFASSSINNESLIHPRVKNIVEVTVEEGYGSQDPCSSAPPAEFTEICADTLDLHSQNLDSPCWKGAPASRISPFDSLEAPSQCHFKNKIEYCDFGQGNLCFPLPEHSGRISSKKLGEENVHNHNGFAGIGLSVPSGGSVSTNNTAEERRAIDVIKDAFEHTNLSSNKGVLQFSENLNKPSKGYDLVHNCENNFQVESSCSEHLNVDEHKFGFTEHNLKESAVHAGILNDAAEGGAVALHAAENVLRSPASQEDAKQAQLHPRTLGPQLDVQTLVDAIHNLSELLKFECLKNAYLLEEQDSDSLKHAITNLDACMSKKMEEKEAMFSVHDTSEKLGESQGSYLFMKENNLDSCGVLGDQHMHEDKSKNYGTESENSRVSTSLKDDLDVSKGEHVVQAIKKVLDENFHRDEEMHSQALLFKNLWLEAEAKLCSISYKARFNRMKLEMEKHKVSQKKDVSENATALNKILTFKFSPDLNTTSSVAPEAENGLAAKTTTHSPSTSSKSVNINEAEDSVMERFSILSRRGENLSSMFMEEKKDSAMVGSDIKDSVMARINILRGRVHNLSSSLVEERKDPAVVANDAVDSVTSRFNILRQRGDSLNSTVMEDLKNPDVVGIDDEDSVMTRFNILKQRGDNPNPPFMEMNKDSDMVGAGLLLGEAEASEVQSPNVVMEPYFQPHSVSLGKLGSYVDASGYDSGKEFHLSAADDPVVQSNMQTRLIIQQSSGSYENSSSDWEHVLEDELVWQR